MLDSMFIDVAITKVVPTPTFGLQVAWVDIRLCGYLPAPGRAIRRMAVFEHPAGHLTIKAPETPGDFPASSFPAVSFSDEELRQRLTDAIIRQLEDPLCPIAMLRREPRR
jgi:hypothetical protein